MGVVNASSAASGIVAVTLLASTFGGFVGAAAGSATVLRSATPIVSVTRHGGLCVTGKECRSTLRIDDGTISADGYIPRRLKPRERAALLRAIGRLDLRSLSTHPFTGTCPTAYDGSESIYRFRGFPRALASCTFDLRGIEAVGLAERLFGSLRPRHA